MRFAALNNSYIYRVIKSSGQDMEERKSTAILATDLMKSQLQRERHLWKDDVGTDLMVIECENSFDLARMRHLMVTVMTV
jgi:hypothetical protein